MYTEEWSSRIIRYLNIYSALAETAKLSAKVVASVYIPTRSVWEFRLVALQPHQQLIFSFLFILVVLMGVCKSKKINSRRKFAPGLLLGGLVTAAGMPSTWGIRRQIQRQNRDLGIRCLREASVVVFSRVKDKLQFIGLSDSHSWTHQKVFLWAQAHGASKMDKCCSLHTASKLHGHWRGQKWHDQQYKKSHFGTALKASPSSGTSPAKGIGAWKSRSWSQTAKFFHQEVCQGSANQEWPKKKKNHCFCTQWWLLGFYWGKWWSSGCWIWSQRSCWWHFWNPL